MQITRSETTAYGHLIEFRLDGRRYIAYQGRWIPDMTEPVSTTLSVYDTVTTEYGDSHQRVAVKTLDEQTWEALVALNEERLDLARRVAALSPAMHRTRSRGEDAPVR